MGKQAMKPHLFTVRVWLEEIEDGQFEYRGRLQHGMHGAARHFQGWAALIDLMDDLMITPKHAGAVGMGTADPSDDETDPAEPDTNAPASMP